MICGEKKHQHDNVQNLTFICTPDLGIYNYDNMCMHIIRRI